MALRVAGILRTVTGTSSSARGARRQILPVFRTAGEWARSPKIAYSAIALLQLKILWGAWIYRDLTSGDTASYFQRAILWHSHGRVDLISSPLYSVYYGWIYGLTGDLYAATVLHRVLLVILVTLLVLALFRRLMSPGIAWLATAWWAVIPFNFDVFEVHLFAILPLVAAPFAVLLWPGPRGRGVALAIMASASVLVRNEMGVVALLLGLLFLVWEVRYAGRAGEAGPRTPATYASAYGMPMVVAGLAVLFFVSRSAIPLSELPKAYAPKHTINMCQAYAFGYKQRYPEWRKDHWTNCSELMQRQFGEPLPTLWTMMRRNPKAVLEHFAWNFRLLPSGLQLSLFGAMSGSITPDYGPVPVIPPRALAGSGLLLILVAAGAATWARRRLASGRDRPPAGILGWLALVPAAAVALLLILPTQRPRPEYLYGLSLPIVAATARFVRTLTRRLEPGDHLRALMPVVMFLAFLVCETYYVPPPGVRQSRPLLETFRRLEPYQALVSAPGMVFFAGQHAFSIDGYMVRPETQPRPQVLGDDVLSRLEDFEPVQAFLDRFGISLFYIDEGVFEKLRSNSLHERFLTGLGRNGWRAVASSRSDGNNWLLAVRTSAADAAARHADRLPPATSPS